MVIAEVNIEKVFRSYVCRTAQWYDRQEEITYCTACGHESKSLWKRTGYMGYGSFDGKVRYCPKCGESINKYENETCDVEHYESAPLDMRIRLEEFQHHLTLTVAGTEIRDDSDIKSGEYWHEQQYRETFRFDIKKRQTFFRQKGREAVELGNPLITEVFNTSILRYLFAHKTITPYRAEINNLLKKLRDRVIRKLAESVGHPVSSMYVSPGSKYGSMLLPMFNIAYRIVGIDMPNLTEAWRTGITDYRRSAITLLAADEYDMLKMRKAPDSITALLQMANLPDTRKIRHVVHDRPLNFMMLGKLHRIFKDQNNLLTVYEKVKDWEDDPTKMSMHSLINGLKEFQGIYSEREQVKLLQEDHRDLQDIFRMHNGGRMDAELKRNKIRIRDLHDWLVEKHRLERNPVCRFENTEPIRKRLAMQTDLINFFIPNHSEDLVYTGKNLHNCVGTYINRVRDGQTHIVLVADYRGKLIACIEVMGKKIIQAKLNRNKPVSQDAKINAEIIEWAEKVQVNWKSCHDIREIRLPALITQSA